MLSAASRRPPVRLAVGSSAVRSRRPTATFPILAKSSSTNRCACVRLSNPPGTNYLVAGDFQGRFINIADQRRRTTDQPETWDHRVLLFGGSTVFDQEVADQDTLASCLQRALNQRPGPRYRVENYGTPAMIARQQTERLADTPLEPGDVVLFYDGVNDVFYPVYNGNTKGYHLGDSSDGGVRKLSRGQAWLYPLCFRLKDHSWAAALLFRGMDGPRPANLVDAETLSGHLDAAEAGYLQAMTEAHALADSHGAALRSSASAAPVLVGPPQRLQAQSDAQ